MMSRRAVIAGLLGLLLFYIPGCGGGGGGGSADISTSTVVWQEVTRGQYLITATVRNTGGKTASNVRITLQLFRNGTLIGTGNFLLGTVAAGQSRVFQGTVTGPSGATQVRYELNYD